MDIMLFIVFNAQINCIKNNIYYPIKINRLLIKICFYDKKKDLLIFQENSVFEPSEGYFIKS